MGREARRHRSGSPFLSTTFTYTRRATCCGTEAASVRSRRAARQFISTPRRAFGAVEGEAKKKIGSVARGPSAPRPGAATLSRRAPKMLLGAKCSEKGPPRRLPSCAERRAGTASAALSYPPPPPRHAGCTYLPAAPCTSSTPILSLLLPAPSARDSTHLGAAPILPLPPSASPWSSPLAPR